MLTDPGRRGALGRQVWRRGASGPVVAEVRQRLVALALIEARSPGGPGADVFDASVEDAVRSFQQQRGIRVDGIVGPTTLRVLEEARWRLGDRILRHSVAHMMAGDDVAALQQRLLEMGFDCGRVDGILGVETGAALRDFQRNVGLVPDGTAGPLTFAALDRLVHTVTGGRPHGLRDDARVRGSGPLLHGKVVVIDPGHGGSDAGCVAHGLREADLAEDLAARVEGRLAATGVLTFLTRGADMELEETERAAFANAAEADLLVSLHVDGCEDAGAEGVATYFYGNDRHGHSSVLGERLAELVQREIADRTGLTDCRTHGKTWDLLRRTRMPAVRVELGYLTHPGDAARLAEAGFRDLVADALVAAVQRLYRPGEPDDATGGTGGLELPALAAR